MTDDPIQRRVEPQALHQARRCGARTRSGQPCRSPAVHGPEQAVMAALHEVSERLQRKGKDYRLYSGSTAGRMLNLSHIERVEAEASRLSPQWTSAPPRRRRWRMSER